MFDQLAVPPISYRNSGRLRLRRAQQMIGALMVLFLAAGFLSPLQAAAASSHCKAFHVVQAGDTVLKLSRAYGVSVGSIVQVNALPDANRIYVGQRLCIPAATTTPTTCRAQHVVKRGEILTGIARQYGVSWQSIATANKLANPNHIYVGQRLCIPSGGTQPVPGAPIPTFTITGVTRDQNVTIRTANFPANQTFVVRMGAFGTQGINGTHVTTINSGSGGTFSGTYNIPAHLRGSHRIAIRLESPAGYFSYNWFFNNTTN